jgi:hypothetical protein
VTEAGLQGGSGCLLSRMFVGRQHFLEYFLGRGGCWWQAQIVRGFQIAKEQAVLAAKARAQKQMDQDQLDIGEDEYDGYEEES